MAKMFNNGKILNGPWMIKEEVFKKLDEEKKILWTSGGDEQPYGKIYLHESTGQIANDFWDTKFGSNQEASLSLEKLFEKRYFDFPKSTILLKNIITIGSNTNDLILDFLAGSDTTAHAVMDLNKEDASTGLAQAGNRKYICVQLPELTEEKSEAYKAGYKTIADISKERIRRAGKKKQEETKAEIENIEIEIKKLQGELPTDETKAEIENLKTKIEQLQHQDLGFKVLKFEDSNFKQWQQIEGKDLSDRQAGAKALAEQMKLFVDPVSESATTENMVYELLLKNGKDLNSPIEKKSSFYKINDTELILLLEKATREIIDAVIAEKPIKVFALDKLFKGNDQLKTNTVLQMKDAGIEFKTI